MIENVLPAARGKPEVAAENSDAYRLLMDLAPDAIVVSGMDGRILDVNRRACELTGYAREELLRLSVQDVYPPGATMPALEPASNSSRRVLREHTIRRKDRLLVPVEVSAVTLPHGRRYAIVRDVTDRHQLEERLRHAQKMESLGQLTGGIAHDFNNLLTVIMANAELLQADMPQSIELLAGLSDLQAAARRGQVMIRKLMGFARQGKLELAPTDLGALLEQLGVTLKRVLPEHIHVRVTIQEALPEALVDPNAIEQILLNLATNARDAMADGGVLSLEALRARVDGVARPVDEGSPPGEYVCIAVSDTGVGMDEHVQRRLFEPFFTTKPPGMGTGLGMSMVYGLVKQHQGFVHIYSELGLGSTIRVYVPIAHDPGRQPSAPESKAEVDHSFGSETILVVEDADSLRDVAQRVLQRFGYRVITAADGEEAVRCHEAHGPKIDLIVTDVIMPNCGGATLYERIRARDTRVRFLFASGYTAAQVHEDTGLDEQAPFLPKPWSASDLLHGVRKALDAPPPPWDQVPVIRSPGSPGGLPPGSPDAVAVIGARRSSTPRGRRRPSISDDGLSFGS